MPRGLIRDLIAGRRFVGRLRRIRQTLGTLRIERDNFAVLSLVPLHRGGDTSRGSIGNRPEWIVRKVRIDFGRGRRRVSKDCSGHL